MRYDEIDLNLNGKLTIQGVQGGDKNLIQYKDGFVSWVTASTPTAIDSLIKNIGNHFQIVESDPSDSVLSGQKLVDAYAKIVADEATLNLSETNRYTLLLTPGVYDIQDNLEISIGYVDIIGMSTNPMSTKLTSNYQTFAVNFTGPNHKLKNLNLGYASTGCIGFGTTYLTAENLIISYNPFSGTDLRGEFKNIKVLPSVNFCIGHSSIDAIFDNIYFEGSSGTIFLAGVDGMIQGTFSNITFENLSSQCFYHSSPSDYDVKINLYNFKIVSGSSDFINVTGTVSGTFENLEIKTNAIDCLVSTKGILGTYRNLKFVSDYPSSNFFKGDYIDGVFENITIESTNNVQDIFSVGKQLSGTFSNFNLKYTLVNACFRTTSPNGIVNMYFDGLKTTGDTGFGFTPTDSVDISGVFKNFDIGQSSDFFSITVGGNLIADFENISLKNQTNYLFSVNYGKISGNFKNIKVYNTQNSTRMFYGMDGLSGIFDNIENYNADGQMCQSVFESGEYIYGTFKNLQLTANSILEAGKTISCIVDNLQFNSDDLINSANSHVICTASNITYMSGTNIIANAFTSTMYNVEGTYDRIYLEGELFGKVFSAGNFLRGRFSNIRLGYCNPSMVDDVFKAYDINGEFSDIICGSGSGYNIFSSGDNLRGTFSNIRIGNNWSSIFTTTNEISGTFRDLYIPNTVSNSSFEAISMSYSTIFDNVINFNRFKSVFSGVMTNCVMVDTNKPSPPSGYEPMEIDFTNVVLIENTDFHYEATIEYGYGFGSRYVSGDLFSNPWYGTVQDVHILKCGFYIGLPPEFDVIFVDDPTNYGIVALLDSGAYNVTGIPRPK